MPNLKNRIKSALAAEAFFQVLSRLSGVSNKGLIRLTYLAKNILTRDDPIIKKALVELRRYFRENHPCVDLIRRISRALNPKCRKTLIKTFFVNAVFKGISQTKEYADRQGFLPPWFLVLSPTMRCNLNCIGCSTRRYAKSDDLPIPVIDKGTTSPNAWHWGIRVRA